MITAPEPRTEAATQGLKSLRTSAWLVQKNRGLTDAEMAGLLGSLRATYARRAHRVTETSAKENPS